MTQAFVVGLVIVTFLMYMTAVLVIGKHEKFGYFMTLPFRVVALPLMAISNSQATGVPLEVNLSYAIGMALLLSFEHRHLPKVGLALVILGFIL